MSKKLEQVLEYLIAGKQDQAKELLHQVFIEKARKIHEDIMSHDDMEEDHDLGGDEGDDWKHDIMGDHDEHLEELSDEIDAEETMAEDEDVSVGDDDMMDMHDDMGGDDMGGDDMAADDMGGDDAEGMEGIEDTIGDLEDALAELKAEFERLESGEEDAGEEAGEEDAGEEDAGEEAGEEDASEEDAGEESSEEDMDESWLEEDWDDLAEAIDLEKVKVPASGEVGSGTFSSADANAKAKSPIATSQTQRMGAKPIKTDDKHHSGYNRETAPSSKDMGITNRRKTAETGMSKVSKEGNSSAALNKTVSEFGIDKDSMSPLSKSPRK